MVTWTVFVRFTFDNNVSYINYKQAILLSYSFLTRCDISKRHCKWVAYKISCIIKIACELGRLGIRVREIIRKLMKRTRMSVILSCDSSISPENQKWCVKCPHKYFCSWSKCVPNARGLFIEFLKPVEF